MPFVSGFTLRFFEFSIAVAVTGRWRVDSETNVYVGIARAHVRTDTDRYDRWSSMCIRVSFSFISSFYFYQLFFSLGLEKLEIDVSFSGHCARRKKRLKAEEARQTATKRVTTNGFSSSGLFK